MTAIEIVGRSERALRYVERQGGDSILFELVEEAPGARFRSTIADPDLPFGGAWTIALAPEGAGTRVRIEENGEVRDPAYRFFSALVFGHDGTMKAYLADMARSFEFAVSTNSTALRMSGSGDASAAVPADHQLEAGPGRIDRRRP